MPLAWLGVGLAGAEQVGPGLQPSVLATAGLFISLVRVSDSSAYCFCFVLGLFFVFFFLSLGFYFLSFFLSLKLGTMTHACNPSSWQEGYREFEAMLSSVAQKTKVTNLRALMCHLVIEVIS